MESSRRLGKKVRCNYTILPETANWLRGRPNASEMLDVLVGGFRDGKLVYKDIQAEKKDGQTLPNDVYEQIDSLEKENEQLRSQLEDFKRLEKDATDQLAKCQSETLKAKDILKDALNNFKHNNGTSLRNAVVKALPLIDDV